MEEMTKEMASKIVDKMDRDTIKELSEYYYLWFREQRRIGIALTQEYRITPEKIKALNEKKVSELNNEDIITLFTHIFIGDDYHVRKPEPIIVSREEMSDDMKYCFKACATMLKMFAEANAEKLNELTSGPAMLTYLKTQPVMNLSLIELMIIIANVKWDYNLDKNRTNL